MSTCHCFSGVPADDGFEPLGALLTIAGLKVYKSTPHSIGSKFKGSILFLPDGFGLARHNQRLADMYAEQGYETTIVDYFEGDALPDIFMKYLPGTDLDSYDNLTPEEKDIIRKIDMPSWLERHTPNHISSLLNHFLPDFFKTVSTQSSKAKRGPNTKTLFIVGHCFGGKHALNLAHNESEVTSVIVFHPSFLDPLDTENLKRPIFMGLAETDVFTPELSSTMLSQLPSSGTRYKLLVYGGTKHGFASRSDLGNQLEKDMFVEAFNDGLRWMESTS
ncbi:alpha/beta-hydrolase [Annulohypoxylon maeteangense]|uniref:alpha/beta-hydrolase n=1 Tax=Annulohypoxylon maeteangense TaxID=1927788 RepID=UPI002007EE0C|nr:alpha/beta-hydrolase [Annulohypoxylon maeteangense]KAI0886405.1 alpha/beta-hydrolase [Annulohypoxylon maeteangense]